MKEAWDKKLGTYWEYLFKSPHLILMTRCLSFSGRWKIYGFTYLHDVWRNYP